MEKQKLPNGVASIVLGVFGYLCCCILGAGIIPAGIGFFLANKSQKMYKEDPDAYDNYSQIKTARIVALIALILNVLMIIRVIYVISTVGWDEMIQIYQDAYQQAMEQQGN
ncbi:CCC motif membrane protein [Spongiivirga sp. MCCC 1A20706]|uniref:CCC motif membrane protein n=1 Tax=Spongiivirga sp. MCCC 1A20706 TaxID=3160963 RepID=UPI003977D6D0